MERKTAVVIPARYASTRFPGKMLAELRGKPIIQWVHEKAAASKADAVIIATDHQDIFDAVESFGGKAVMTKPEHPSGTDRIAEAVKSLDAEVIINVQGDEPLIPTEVINGLIDKMLAEKSLEMATVATSCERKTFENNPNMVKVVLGKGDFALYFSRSMIPYLREGGEEAGAYLHWGIYAYRRDILEKIVSLPEGRLEKCEKLEQLRALENGIGIYVLLSELESVGIDTPEDLERAEKRLSEGI
jgi:3-deoxy-manno-octulosonate cytidylyltransferase (CMP-KDO synthetase)